MSRISILGEDDCWEWQGCVNSKGYGTFGINRKSWIAPRYSYFIHKGDPGELHVCHKCDNPKCCNPNHLFLGTHIDNMQDMVKKGRQINSNAKITKEQVIEIRDLLSMGELTQKAIASRFNLKEAAVYRINRKITWSRV